MMTIKTIRQPSEPLEKGDGSTGIVRKPYGFTLVELLVVIAILSVLAGLLLPALEEAIDSAHTIQCGNNMRQLQLAYSFYIEDNDGHVAQYGRMVYPHWYGILGPYIGEERDPTTIMNSVHWNSPDKDVAVGTVRCPSRTNAQQEHGTNQYLYTNYGHNRCVLMVSKCSGGAKYFTSTINDIPNPSRTMLFYDAGEGTPAYGQICLFDSDHTGYISSLSGGRVNWGAHDEGTNFCFMDGRVERRNEFDSRLKTDWYATRSWPGTGTVLF